MSEQHLMLAFLCIRHDALMIRGYFFINKNILIYFIRQQMEEFWKNLPFNRITRRDQASKPTWFYNRSYSEL